MILGQSDRHRSHKSNAVCPRGLAVSFDRVELTIQGSRLAAPATAASTTRPGVLGWRAVSRRPIQAFAAGQRRNDIIQQMRNIARAIIPQEIEEAAAYYASQPPEIVKATDQ
jgi:hypothetical protein